MMMVQIGDLKLSKELKEKFKIDRFRSGRVRVRVRFRSPI